MLLAPLLALVTFLLVFEGGLVTAAFFTGCFFELTSFVDFLTLPFLGGVEVRALALAGLTLAFLDTGLLAFGLSSSEESSFCAFLEFGLLPFGTLSVLVGALLVPESLQNYFY